MFHMPAFTIVISDIGSLIALSSILTTALGTAIGVIGGLLTFKREKPADTNNDLRVTVTIDNGKSKKVLEVHTIDEAEKILHNLDTAS